MCVHVYPVLYTLCSLTGVSVIKADITRCPAQGPSPVSPQLPRASQAGQVPPPPPPPPGAVGGMWLPAVLPQFVCLSLESVAPQGTNSSLLSLSPDTCVQVSAEICSRSEGHSNHKLRRHGLFPTCPKDLSQ